MSKPNISTIMRGARVWMSKHSPEILTGLGIAGMITTTVLAVKATPKAIKLVEKKKEELELEPEEKLTVVETVKAAWKPYIPAAITGTAATACLVGASSVNLRRNAALAAAYHLSETALTEYKEKVIETVGKNKEKTIRDKISEDRVKQNPVSNNTVYVTGAGDSLFLEPISKRYFKHDIERIRGIVNTLNERMYGDAFGQISLSDFYDELGLERTDISDDMGWNIEKGSIKIDFHPVMCDDENSPYHNKPCLAIYYSTTPKWGYDR